MNSVVFFLLFLIDIGRSIPTTTRAAMPQQSLFIYFSPRRRRWRVTKAVAERSIAAAEAVLAAAVTESLASDGSVIEAIGADLARELRRQPVVDADADASPYHGGLYFLSESRAPVSTLARFCLAWSRTGRFPHDSGGEWDAAVPRGVEQLTTSAALHGGEAAVAVRAIVPAILEAAAAGLSASPASRAAEAAADAIWLEERGSASSSSSASPPPCSNTTTLRSPSRAEVRLAGELLAAMGPGPLLALLGVRRTVGSLGQDRLGQGSPGESGLRETARLPPPREVLEAAFHRLHRPNSSSRLTVVSA